MPPRPTRAAKRRAKRRLDHSQTQEDSENEAPMPAPKRRKTSKKSQSSQSSQTSQTSQPSSQKSRTSQSSNSKKTQPKRRGRKRAQRHSSDSADESETEQRPSKKRRVDSPKQSKGIRPRGRRRPANERATEDESGSAPPSSQQDSSVSPESALAGRRAEMIIRWLTGGESLKNKVETIQGWLDEDEEAFALAILQMMLRLAGARTYRLTREHLEGPTNTERDVKALVKEIETSYENVEDDDEDDEKEEEKQDEERPARRGRKPAKKSDKPELFARGWNKLLSRYKQFITLVADKNIATVFEADYFYETFINWCKMLARHAEMRQLRRVAVHTAFYMMDGIVGHLASTRKDVLVSERKLENVKDDPEKEAAKRRLEKQVEEQKDRLNQIKALTDIVLDQIVAYKYADTDAQIRELVLKCIPNWVNTDPSQTYLLTNHWIKFLSWGLHDSDAGVRKAGLDGLEKLFHYKRKSRGKKSKDSSSGAIDSDRLRALSSLLNKYKERILEMSQDIDADCCSTAIGLLTTLLRNSLLNEDEANDVADCIFDENVSVRQAAATFIYADSFEWIEEQKNADMTDKHQKDLIELCRILRDRNLALCKKYGKAATNRSFVEPAAFVVNEMYTFLDCLRDWETMIDLLLQSEESEDTRDQRNMRKKKKPRGSKSIIRESEQANLCYILLASVKKACRELDGSISFGRKAVKKRVKKSEEVEMDKWFEDFSTKCAPRIADLLKTFQADSIKSYAIVQMIQHLPLDIFEAQDVRGKLDTIVETLSRMFLIHEMPMRAQVEEVDDSKQEFSNRSQIAQASAVTRYYTDRVNLDMQYQIMNAFQYLSNEHHTYREPVQDAILDIVNQVIERFDELRGDFVDNCESHDGEDDVKLSPEESENMQSMFSCLSRLQHISAALKVGRIQWNEDFSDILRAASQSSVPEYKEFMSPLIQMLVSDVMWNLQANPNQDSFEFSEKLRERVEIIHDILDRLLEEGIANLEESESDESAYMLNQDGQVMENSVGHLVDALVCTHLRVESNGQLRRMWKDGNVTALSDALCAKLGDFYRLVLLFFHVTSGVRQTGDTNLTQDVSDTDPAAVFGGENMELRSLVRCCRVGTSVPYVASKLSAIALSFIRRGIGRSKLKEWRQRHRDILDGFYKRLVRSGEDYRTDICFDAVLEIFRHEPEESRSDSLENFCALIQQKLSGIRKKRQGTFVKLVLTCLRHVMTPEHIVEHIPLLPPVLRFIRMSVNRDVLKLWQQFKELERPLPSDGQGDAWDEYAVFREEFHKLVKKSRERRDIAVESDDEDPSQQPGRGDGGNGDDSQGEVQDVERSQVFGESQASFNFDENPEQAEQKGMEVDVETTSSAERPRGKKMSRPETEAKSDDIDVEMDAPPTNQSKSARSTPRRSPRKKRRGGQRTTPNRGQWVQRK